MNAKLFVAWTVISCLMQLTMGLKVENNQDLEATFTRIKRSLVHQDIFEINPQIAERAKPGHGNDGDDDNKECPPCFNCNLPNFECTQFSQCNTFTGMCECQDGFGGNDCSEPLCGSLGDGNSKRPVRKRNCVHVNQDGLESIVTCVKETMCDQFMPEGLKELVIEKVL